MCDNTNCRHKTGFFKWIVAIEYSGYYECENCHQQISITETDRKKLHASYWMILLWTFVAGILAVELQKSWILYIGWILGILFYFSRMYYLWYRVFCATPKEKE